MASKLLRCAGFVALLFVVNALMPYVLRLVDYVVMPAVLWTVLALFGAVPA